MTDHDTGQCTPDRTISVRYRGAVESFVDFARTSNAEATSGFETFRSVLGRRTPDQVRSLDWSGELDALDPVLAAWFAFGPSEIGIVE